MKEIYNVLEDLFRRCLKKSNVFSFYFERYESKSLALKTPNQNTSIWVFLKQIMLVGKCRLLILLCNRLFFFLSFFLNEVFSSKTAPLIQINNNRCQIKKRQ